MPLYSALSLHYDDFFDKNYLQGLQNKYLLLLKKNGIKTGNVLDAGCGTGMLSMHLYDNGYNIIGADLSEDMLAVARKKSLVGNKNILWYNCNIAVSLPQNYTYNAIVSSLDVVNHITEKKDVASFFVQAYDALEENGVFIFDINSYKKFSRQYAQRKYVYSTHHAVCVWRNSFDRSQNLCKMNVEVYSKGDKGYGKKSDCFYERYYSPYLIHSMLRKAGFRRFAITTVDKGTRYIIVAKK